jgi:hypothetical protein
MGNSIINLRQKDDLVLPAGIRTDEQELIPSGAPDPAKRG